MHSPAKPSAVGLAAAALTLTASPALGAGDIDLNAYLRGSSSFPKTHGSSEYDRDSGNREVEVTLMHARKLGGQRVKVIVAGKKIGTMRVRGTGAAHGEWDSAHGDFVPRTSAGTGVSVKTMAGRTVVGGHYHLDTHD
jgi:hypothetical protein